MADESYPILEDEESAVKGGSFNALTAAALFGGAVAASAGAYFGTRALARRNREKDGRPLNSVMAAAITACDVNHVKETEQRTETEPPVPSEPRV